MTAGFDVLDSPRSHGSPWWTDLICRPNARGPSMPPIDHYRKRAEARQTERGSDPL